MLHHQRLAEPFVLHPSGITFLAFCNFEVFVDSTLRLSSATGGGLTQQLYMNGLHAMIAFLADIRMRTAYGVVRRKHPGEECHHGAEIPQKASRQTFYSACNAYHQIIKRHKIPSAVSRLLQAHVSGVMP